ncbi:sphingomyelin synthase family protein [Patescibacteria group bacterium]|nr:sphingomyelin synthase family protein [Patescibacteria group bacterium]MBU1908090.1 sphingomyelin synthase family protein [Patescibacteria group bacterium]
MHIFKRHAFHWRQKSFILTSATGVILLALSVVANYFAGLYADNKMSNSVTDLILSNLPVVNVDPIFVEGFALFLLVVFALAFWEPKRIPFVLKSVALFIFVRSFFVILTHIGPFPVTSPVDGGFFTDKINFTGDLFFSGHTGLPFLMALTFWNNRLWRNIFLSATALFAATVLLGHLHYSIDVFGALFITFSIHNLALVFFKKDFELFEKIVSYEIRV